jgi:hypothetical protein
MENMGFDSARNALMFAGLCSGAGALIPYLRDRKMLPMGEMWTYYLWTIGTCLSFIIAILAAIISIFSYVAGSILLVVSCGVLLLWLLLFIGIFLYIVLSGRSLE